VFYCVFIVILIEHYVLFLNPACLCCHSIINVCISLVTLDTLVVLIDCTNGRAYATVLRPSVAVCRL